MRFHRCTAVLYRAAWTLSISILAACTGGSDGTGPEDEGPDDPQAQALPPCPAAPFLTVSPVAFEDIRELGPLGFLNPPGHTFPGQHMGFVTERDPATGGTMTAPVRAPGDIRITGVVANHFEFAGTTPGDTLRKTDYTLVFFACSDVRFYFGHVSTLAPTLESAIGTFDDTDCNPPYTTGGTTNTQCWKTVSIDVEAGDLLGSMGGATQGGMDFGAADRRVTPPPWANPDRFENFDDDWGPGHVVCAADYFVPGIRNVLETMFGWDGRPRTGEPACGEYAQDVPGTAQGRWYFDDSLLEDRHLALVHHMVDPSLGVFSVGTSIPSAAQGLYVFSPQTTGRVNLDFLHVTPGSGIHCYEFQPGGVYYSLDQVIFIELTPDETLRIEGRPGSACGDPSDWAFTPEAVQFQR
jgi:hypothetical protein